MGNRQFALPIMQNLDMEEGPPPTPTPTRFTLTSPFPQMFVGGPGLRRDDPPPL